MSYRRRPLALLALAITSYVLAACSQVTAPRSDTDTPPDSTCRSGWMGSSGRC